MARILVVFRQLRQVAVCRSFVSDVGNSTKAPSSAGSERGGAAGSQHDEDIVSELQKTQGQAGVLPMLSFVSSCRIKQEYTFSGQK